MYLLYVIVIILQIPIERLGSLIVLHYKLISPVPIQWHCLLYDTIIITKRLLKLQKKFNICRNRFSQVVRFFKTLNLFLLKK